MLLFAQNVGSYETHNKNKLYTRQATGFRHRALRSGRELAMQA